MSERSKAILAHFNEAIRVGPNPVVRNAELGKVIGAFQAPEVNFARTVQGLVAGELTDVAGEMKALKDRYNAALDAAFATAKAGGATVDRSDLVFANWNPDADFGAADY